jgi:SAM-dependent methyltransferase
MDAAQAFGAVSEAYAKYRPTYPPALFTAILDHNPALQPTAQRRVAVEVACGSGQATSALAALFERVIALDSSRPQLDAARARLAGLTLAASSQNNDGDAAAPSSVAARVELREGDAHDTGLPGGEAELVAVAQALHWFDVPSFAREAARLLRPHGSLAAWSYGLARVASVAGGGGGGGGARPTTPGDESNEQARDREQEQEQERARVPLPPPSAGQGAADAADAAVRRAYEALADFWDERRLHGDDGYARLIPLLVDDPEGKASPPAPFGRVETRAIEMRAWRRVDEVVGYVASWSAVERARQALAARRRRRAQKEHQEQEGEQEEEEEEEDEDPVAVFRRELVAALGGAEDASLELVTPVTLVLASEPRREGGPTAAA